MKRHLLICGERGAGKSTLIRRLLEHSTREVGGFVTKRLPVADENGFFPIYLYPASQSEGERRNETANLVGTCDSRSSIRHPEVFDTLGAQLIESALEGGIILMDELGFLEMTPGCSSPRCCAHWTAIRRCWPRSSRRTRRSCAPCAGMRTRSLSSLTSRTVTRFLKSSCRTFCGGMKVEAASSPCNREEVFKRTLV